MFTAKVYNVMIGSLSGAMEEVHIAKEIIRKWNQDNASKVGILYMPVEWSTKKEDMSKTDIVIGIVGDWIKNSDYIEEYVRMRKLVILFFQSYHDPKVSIPGEVQELEMFRSSMQTECSCYDYRRKDEIERALILRLSKPI